MILWAFKCENEVVTDFPPPNRWANKIGQSRLGIVCIVHNQHHIMKKMGVLQLALQLNFWIAKDTYNTLYLYAMSANRQVTWIVTHRIYGATH